jgi:hypothetical protein
MEYCPHCRAIRPTRKSTRKRTVRQPDGSVKTITVDSFHCTRCNAFIGSVDREVTPEGADQRTAAPGEAPATATEEAVQVGAGEGEEHE